MSFGEENMDKTELNKLKEDLRKEKEAIESELSGFTVKNPVVKDDYQALFPKADQSDTLDEQAHNVTEYEQGRELEQSLELRLREINETLGKIETGAFGVCHKCKSPIEENRLKAQPVAKFCINCAKEFRLIG